MESEKQDTLRCAPTEYVHVAAKDIRERMKVCDALHSYLEDFSEVENIYGKCLLKICNNSSNQTKGEWLVSIHAAWESVYRMSSAFGKEHVALSNNLIQSVGRTFPEYSRSGTRKIQSLVSKVSQSAIFFTSIFNSDVFVP